MKLTRRTLLGHALVAGSSTAISTLSTNAVSMPMTLDTTPPTSVNLAATAQIETAHPRIVALSKEITRDAKTELAAAILLHDWVRDQIPFGVNRTFYETTATEVLDEKLGYCNTKVTLLNALFRARGLPTRIRMMDLSAQVLKGLFDPGTAYVDHAITEVFLDGKWIKVDSYVVDKPLADAARRKLKIGNSGLTYSLAGFGIHLGGKSDWDGKSDSLIQCVMDGKPESYVLKDHGVFDDVANFYSQVAAARNRRTLGFGLQIRFGASFVNRQITNFREGST